jgi:pimeloyl-ACP methyl ester carboxylesterase
MKAEMVTIKTEDRVVLHGLLYEGRSDYPAVILLPGAGMNFYSGLGAFLPEILARNGYSCFSVNHRGHDQATAPDLVNPRVIGAMNDCFEDCIIDIKAMVSALNDQGFKQIIIAGHSQAVVKILYFLREVNPDNIAGIVIISPPPTVPEMLKFLLGSKLYEKGLNEALKLAENDDYDRILFFKGRGNLTYSFSARTYLNFYGPDSRANTLALIKGLSYPMLAVRGQFDLPPVTSQLMETIKKEYDYPDLCQSIELEGANHFYYGHEELLGDTVVGWLNNLIKA